MIFLTSLGSMAKSASRSMCSGWWITETTGTPVARMPSSPQESDWLSNTTSKRWRSCRRFQRHSRRRPKVCISGNTPKRDTPSSHRWTGCSRARGSARRAQSANFTPNTFGLGITCRGMPGSSSGRGGPAITWTSWPARCHSRARWAA